MSARKWLIAAMIAPTVSLAAQCDWITVLVTGIIFGAVSVAVAAGCKRTCCLNRWVACGEYIWLGFVCGSYAQMCGGVWGDDSSSLIIPLALLALAAFGAQGEPRRAADQSGIIYGIVRVAIIAVLLAGIPGRDSASALIQCNWNAQLAQLFLLPCLITFLPVESGGALKPVVFVLILAAATAWIAGGSAMTGESAFYYYSKSVSLFKTARRFEAVVSFVLTIGWYSLLSMLLSVVGSVSSHIGVIPRKTRVWIIALFASLTCLCNMSIPADISLLLTMLFWGVIPVTTQFLGRK